MHFALPAGLIVLSASLASAGHGDIYYSQQPPRPRPTPHSYHHKRQEAPFQRIAMELEGRDFNDLYDSHLARRDWEAYTAGYVRREADEGAGQALGDAAAEAVGEEAASFIPGVAGKLAKPVMGEAFKLGAHAVENNKYAQQGVHAVEANHAVHAVDHAISGAAHKVGHALGWKREAEAEAEAEADAEAEAEADWEGYEYDY